MQCPTGVKFRLSVRYGANASKGGRTMPFGRFTAFRDLVPAVYRRAYKRSHWSIDAWLSSVVARTFRGLPGMMLALGSLDIARSGQVWPSNERARPMSKSAIRL